MKWSYAAILAPLFLSCLLLAPDLPPERSPPKVMLWAWERPEDLSFLRTPDVGIAYWAGTVRIHADRVDRIPRLQPLAIHPSTYSMPVVRLEVESGLFSSGRATPSLEEISNAILMSAGPAGRRALQLDYDARKSELQFYQSLLEQLRGKLPGTYLSVTALASRCWQTRWHNQLPIQDAIPMLFRMGPDEREIRRLVRSSTFPGLCGAHSIGLSTDEPVTPRFGRRVYLFSPTPWNPDSYQRAREALK